MFHKVLEMKTVTNLERLAVELKAALVEKLCIMLCRYFRSFNHIVWESWIEHYFHFSVFFSDSNKAICYNKIMNVGKCLEFEVNLL